MRLEVVEHTPTRLVLRRETNVVNMAGIVAALALIPGAVLLFVAPVCVSAYWVIFFLAVAGWVLFASPSTEVWSFDRQTDQLTEQKQKLLGNSTEQHFSLHTVERAHVEEVEGSDGDIIGWNAVLRLHTGEAITLMNYAGAMTNSRRAFELRKELVNQVNHWLGEE
jgi:hypothetical protein